MKVLLLIDGLWVGGSERSLAEMLPHLEAAGIEPLVACLRGREQGVEEEVRRAGTEVVILPGAELATRVLATQVLATQVRAFRGLLRRRRPAVVHSSLFRSNLVARLSRPRSFGARLVNSLVNTPYDAARRGDPAVRPWKLRLVQAADAVTGRLLVDHFHAVSRAVADSARRTLAVPAARITVVERGRDPERLGAPSAERRAAMRRHLGLDPAVPVLLSVGRQDFQKGQEHLLRAAASLTTEHPELVVLVAGREGRMSARLEALAATVGDGRRVRFLGHRGDVPDLLAASDLFVLSSLFEGYPGVVLEALALAVPVVASDIPPAREIVVDGETGLLVPPADPPALAAAVAGLLADPARRRQMGRRGREQFLERHTVATAARRMAHLYRRVAGGGDPGQGDPLILSDSEEIPHE